jgi:flagellar biosynthesis protein FlhA
MPNFINRISNFFKKSADILISTGVVLIVLMLIIPFPGIILDILIVMNVAISILILLIPIKEKKIADLSRIPILLLLTTVFSLAVNVSCTRLILTKGIGFDSRIIRAISNIVSRFDSIEYMMVCLSIFIAIILFQVFIITKGCTRISEVAAQSALDALPGKQMAIEAECNSGIITKEETVMLKKELQQEADFYDSMNGVSKFIAGNTKAEIFICAITIIGGIIIGIKFREETIAEAVRVYVALGIGAGLLGQIPTIMKNWFLKTCLISSFKNLP